MNDETQSKITEYERAYLVEWALQAGQVVDLVDLLILEAEEPDRKIERRRLRVLRKAVQTIDDSIALVYGDVPR